MFDVQDVGQELEVGEVCWRDGSELEQEWDGALEEWWNLVRVRVQTEERWKKMEEWRKEGEESSEGQAVL
jgi:hypothetical protein